MGDDAADLAEYAGLTLDPWQRFVLDRSLGQRRDGRWAAMECALIVPRQNGKGAVIEARQLAALFLTKDPLIIYSAHQFKTAKAMYRRIRDLCKQTPELDQEIRGRYRQSNEETGIEVDWGRLQFVARSTGSGRGLTGNTVFFDEAYNLDSDLLTDMLPTLAAVQNPQVWYVSSAGKEASETLASIRDRGIKGESRLMFCEWSAPDDAETDDVEQLYVSNPAIGYRLGLDFIQQVERPGMKNDEEGFRRERLGIWKPPDTLQVLVEPNQWAALRDPKPAHTGMTAIAVDMTPDQQWCTVAAASLTDTGAAHLEVGYHGPPTPAVVDYIADLVRRWDPVAVVLDPSGPVNSIVPELAAAGIEAETTSMVQMAQACGGLINSVAPRRISHTGDPLLAAAVSSVRKRFMAGGESWAFSRKGPAQISPLVAAALARWGLVTFGRAGSAGPVATPQWTTRTPAPDDMADLATVGF